MKKNLLAVVAVALLAGPMAANAGLIYTFDTSSSGSLAFTVDDFIQPNTSGWESSLTFTLGSLALPDDSATGPTNFVFRGVTSSTGVTGGAWQFDFSSFPLSVGTFTPNRVSIGRIDETGLLTIAATSTSVPEPGTLALFGLGLAGLGFARRHRATN